MKSIKVNRLDAVSNALSRLCSSKHAEVCKVSSAAFSLLDGNRKQSDDLSPLL